MKSLFEKQKKLDDLIVSNLCKRTEKDITHKQLINERLLAVMVELGEFIQEQDHDKKIDEYSDILHFLLSCGIALEIDKCMTKRNIILLYAQAGSNIYLDAILNFNVKFSSFCNNVRTWKYWSTNRKPRDVKEHYHECFIALFGIAKTMNYTIEDIKTAYEMKNQENYRRQEGGY